MLVQAHNPQSVPAPRGWECSAGHPELRAWGPAGSVSQSPSSAGTCTHSHGPACPEHTFSRTVWEISPPKAQRDAELPERRAGGSTPVSPSLNSLGAESHRQPGSLGLGKRQTEPKIPEQELLLPDQRICSGADAQTVCFNKTEPNYFGLNEKFLIYKGFF